MSDETMKGLFSEEAEKAVLGCMMMDAGAAAQGRSLLTTEDFYVPLYRTVFQALQKADPPNIIGVEMELRRMGEWERIGVEWLANISMSVTTSIHIRKYAEKLQELGYYRKIVLKAGEVMQAARRQDMAAISEGLEAMRGENPCGAAETVSLEDALEAYIQEIAEIRRSGKKILGIPTGFKELDGTISGLRKGALHILAARPGMGKSALMMDIARNARKALTEEGGTVAVFSLEMTSKELALRSYTAEYLLDNVNFAIGANNEIWSKLMEDLAKRAEEIHKGIGRIQVDDQYARTVARMDAMLHTMRAQGHDVRLICIDYLQLMQGQGQNRTQEIGSISRGLKRLAKEWDCPVLALSQLNRENEGAADKRPTLANLRDSGDIEQDADVVMFLYRDEYYFPDTEKKNVGELCIAKNRHGSTGVIPLTWLPKSTTYRSAETPSGWHETTEEAPKGWRR